MCRSHFAANDHYSLWRCGYNRDENIFNFALPLPGNPICMRQRCHLKSNSHRVVSLKEYYARDYILKSLEHKDGTHFSSSLQMPCKKLCMLFIENNVVGPKNSRFKIPSEMEVAPRYILLHYLHCLQCLHCYPCLCCLYCLCCLHCFLLEYGFLDFWVKCWMMGDEWLDIPQAVM